MTSDGQPAQGSYLENLPKQPTVVVEYFEMGHLLQMIIYCFQKESFCYLQIFSDKPVTIIVLV